MEKKKRKINSNKKTSAQNKRVSSKTREVTKKVKSSGKKRKIKPIIVVDYIFIVSLVLTIIFGLQTNTIFFYPFVIVLVITIICMGIILVNAIYNKIKKIMNKDKDRKEI